MHPPVEAVWTQLESALHRFILKHVRDEQVAADILQDVFVKMHTHIAELNDAERVQSWVYQIARNAISDYYRRLRPTAELDEQLPSPAPGADDEVTRQLARSLRTMIDSLSDEYRQPLLWDTFDGLSQKEIAERLGISLSGAKSRVQRARQKLRQMLLDCCHFEFDRMGKVMDYHPRTDDCPHCGASEAAH